MENNIPGKQHYAIQGVYLRSGRVFSYAHQVNEIIHASPQTVLEIGKGPGIVCNILQTVGINVTTLDMQPELAPDLVGSVTAIPTDDKSFDATLCCQVLEHLPFDQFGCALREIRRVTKGIFVLSLPHLNPRFRFNIKLPRLPLLQGEIQPPKFLARAIPQSRYNRDGHFWEIGYRGTDFSTVCQAIRANGWKIKRTWRVPELLWHRFFRLEQ